MVLSVRKRDGQTVQGFDRSKIEVAISKAWTSVHGHPPTDERLKQLTAWVVDLLPDNESTVEQIQDIVEISLMKHGEHAVAKSYILYRQKRAELRQVRLHPDPNAVADYIHPSKYSRYIPALGRREVFEETVKRDEEMHLRKFHHLFTSDPKLMDDIFWAFDQVREKKVLPSMRSMQFGGKAIEVTNNRIYNCTFSLVDRPRVFSEAFYLLLCGSGVGFSVQFDHVDRLPALQFIDMNKVRHHSVGDSIEGWADALGALVECYMVTGEYIEFDYSQVRPVGTPLKTSGGKAPGHPALKRSLEHIRAVLDGAVGRKLRPIECHDIMCHSADAVLSGGIRRSAMISLFSLEDSEMMYAKTGKWFDKNPWRSNANNSVMLKRDEVKKSQFKRIFQMTKDWGEPGFFFCSDLDSGSNPCAEISLNPVLTIDKDVQGMLAARKAAGKRGPDIDLQPGSKVSGWAFCNLTEMNAAKFKTADDFLNAARAATLIGTLQATYTDMAYLGWVSEVIAEREALLGVGMTGMLDSPEIACNPEYQRLVAEKVIEWNREYARRLGIRPAARTTCVKPSGTTSLELGCVGSGHHAHHAKRYIRRVVANELEAVFLYFQSINPHMCIRKPNGDWVIEFPVEAPTGATVKEDLTAIQFLEMVRSTQVNWVLSGTARPESSPGLAHNVSNTCHVKPDEWDTVAEFLWQDRHLFTGVTLLPVTGDKQYAFAPNEAIVTEADETRWNQLLAGYQPVDYTLMREAQDNTDLSQEPACVGGACSL